MVLRVVLAAVFVAPLSRIGIIFALPEVSESSDSACPIPWFANSKKTVEGRRTYYSGDYFGKYLVMSSFGQIKFLLLLLAVI